MAAQMKNFLDQTGALCGPGQAGRQGRLGVRELEHAARRRPGKHDLSTHIVLLHQGMVIVRPAVCVTGQMRIDEITGGSLRHQHDRPPPTARAGLRPTTSRRALAGPARGRSPPSWRPEGAAGATQRGCHRATVQAYGTRRAGREASRRGAMPRATSDGARCSRRGFSYRSAPIPGVHFWRCRRARRRPVASMSPARRKTGAGFTPHARPPACRWRCSRRVRGYVVSG